MEIQEILSRIQKGEVTHIKETVSVQFDNGQQTPLGFKWRGRHYEVLKLLQSSKNVNGLLQYLLLTDGGVFSLVLQREKNAAPLSRSSWLLLYQVDDRAGEIPAVKEGVLPESRHLPVQGRGRLAMVPLLLANVAQYHGHLCPELAVGYRAALVAREALGLSRENAPGFFVLAENMSSAVEALQLMTGCTIGNGNFFAYDLGKHVYYFGSFANSWQREKTLRLALTSLAVDLSCKSSLANKIIAGQAAPEEQREYQQAVDAAVAEILALPEGELFARSWVAMRPPRPLACQDYTRCAGCGEVLAVAKSIPGEGGLFCQVCWARAM